MIVWLVFIVTTFYKEILFLNANGVDPDQTPRSTLFANVPFMGHKA